MTEIDQAAIDSFEAEKHQKRSRDNLEQSWVIYRDALKFISQMIQVPADKLNNYLRTIFFLLLLGLIFPFNLLITILTLLFSNAMQFNQDKQSLPRSSAHPKRILVSGGMMTKALQLCRGFHQAGHRVILIDDSINWLTGHRWSNSVERFYVVPSPEKEAENYIETLKNIVQKEKIDMFVPATGPYHAHIDARVSDRFFASTKMIPFLFPGWHRARSHWVHDHSHDCR